jgi:hypothetical protein
MLVRLRHVHPAFHEHEQVRLVAHLAFSFHFYTGLLQTLLVRILVNFVVVLISGATAENRVNGRVDEPVSELAPFRLAEGPILELQTLGREIVFGGLAGGACLAQFHPKMGERVHDQHGPMCLRLLNGGQEVGEMPASWPYAA